MSIRLAIPSKGRLQNDSFAWLSAHGFEPSLSGAEREYSASLEGADGVELILMSASEIPAALYDGRIELGVTGQDLVHEKIADWQDCISELAPMGFGHADLVLAVPAAWIDVEDLEDLDAVCADFRQNYGFRLRIATKYHRLVGDYLRQNEVTNFQLVDSQGATEGAVANEYAEMIADITSTGETIRANHLKILGEPILRSQATIFATKRELPDADQAHFDQFCRKLANP